MSDAAEKEFFLRHIHLALAVTFLLGAFYRLQFAGILQLPSPWNLRQSHAHLGFYGALMPLVWWTSRQSGGYLFSRRAMQVYFGTTWISVVGFAWGGYHLISHLGSAVVAGFWVVYAKKNAQWSMLRSHAIRDVIPWGYWGSFMGL